MYFIEKEKDLIGEEIIFTHFAQFADAMVIVTKEKGVFVFDKDEEGIDVYREGIARRLILNNRYLRTELNNLGIITNEEIESYMQKLKEEQEKQRELMKKQEEEREHREYLRLKEKYEK